MNKNNKEYLVMHAHTMGLNENFDDEIVEIAIVNNNEKVLLNTLVKPKKNISDSAIQIHKITDEIVKNSPTFLDIYDDLKSILCNKKVYIYNASFLLDILKSTLNINKLELINFDAKCVMNLFSNNVYKDWNKDYGNYTFQSLLTAYTHYYKDDEFKLLNEQKNRTYKALNDCLMTSKIIKKINQK
ncbi:3'-5' exonuclease [Gilliamella apis]|uniref:Exonuclease domain-containing protein n=1 Tax=Gilliamella apis TaxID=1970738 RepID=A0A2V4DTG4_9GAMM|nr:3'-5' exonuclease [Gilliamella apis]PXY91706.1 hypothetical protein DKK78_05140 [Gilliamella apis]WLS93290.1 3'-5' exonuclease [Gilliamella apis]